MNVDTMIALLQSGTMDGGMMSEMMNGAMGGGMMMLGPIFPLLVLGLLVLLVVWGVRELRSSDGDEAPGSDDAFQTARQRYARGEIGREEFERLRDDLRSP